MIFKQHLNQPVYTNKARCRDCYRCVRSCPVKAIYIENGQAFVDGSLCINCGTCIRECPQGAKKFRDDTAVVRDMIEAGLRVAASVAPSFAAVFEKWELSRLPSALRAAGFCHVSETAIGARIITEEAKKLIAENPGKSFIFSACPAVVNVVSKHYPHLKDSLMDIASPMLAHAEYLKNHENVDAVVFIGPCVAKKDEADSHTGKKFVDAAITFSELREYLKEEKIDLKGCEESGFDLTAVRKFRKYALEGAALSTADVKTEFVAVSGGSRVLSCLDAFEEIGEGVIAELLFCEGGCIDGPGTGKHDNVFISRKKMENIEIIRDSESESEITFTASGSWIGDVKAVVREEPSDTEIAEALKKAGKFKKEDELDCGACGYQTCREKARAVACGKAEASMCIPYMREQAEKAGDSIMNTSPNGIVIFDTDLNIVSANQAFSKMFASSEGVTGRHISNFMDPHPFEKVVDGKTVKFTEDIYHEKYSIHTRQIIYRLNESGRYAAMFIDLTVKEKSERELKHMKEEILSQARDLYEHQLESARLLAGALGEYTSRGEVLLDKLIEAAGDD